MGTTPDFHLGISPARTTDGQRERCIKSRLGDIRVFDGVDAVPRGFFVGRSPQISVAAPRLLNGLRKSSV